MMTPEAVVQLLGLESVVAVRVVMGGMEYLVEGVKLRPATGSEDSRALRLGPQKLTAILSVSLVDMTGGTREDQTVRASTSEDGLDA